MLVEFDKRNGEEQVDSDLGFGYNKTEENHHRNP
jgi:hypothetical protein